MKLKAANLKKYFLYFMVYSIIGWICEVLLVIVKKQEYSNRGVLLGPYCPVYGVGALLFIFIIYRLIKDKPLKRKIIMIPVVFILCSLTATLVELLTSYICELISGSWPWSYSDYKYNFQGRIALQTCLLFGLGGVLILYILQPLFEKLLKKIGTKKINILFSITVVIFTVEVIYFIIKKFI